MDPTRQGGVGPRAPGDPEGSSASDPPERPTARSVAWDGATRVPHGPVDRDELPGVRVPVQAHAEDAEARVLSDLVVRVLRVQERVDPAAAGADDEFADPVRGSSAIRILLRVALVVVLVTVQ